MADPAAAAAAAAAASGLAAGSVPPGGPALENVACSLDPPHAARTLPPPNAVDRERVMMVTDVSLTELV